MLTYFFVGAALLTRELFIKVYSSFNKFIDLKGVDQEDLKLFFSGCTMQCLC